MQKRHVGINKIYIENVLFLSCNYSILLTYIIKIEMRSILNNIQTNNSNLNKKLASINLNFANRFFFNVENLFYFTEIKLHLFRILIISLFY
jgi:hypothetical protein